MSDVRVIGKPKSVVEHVRVKQNKTTSMNKSLIRTQHGTLQNETKQIGNQQRARTCRRI